MMECAKKCCKMKMGVVEKLSTLKSPESPKNRVMHGVIHVIHRKTHVFRAEKSTKNEQLFCEDIINFA